jgi:PAS domain S-box-containing protein
MSSAEPIFEAAPPASAALPSAVLERLPAAAYTCDAEGRLTAFNERAAALWGRHPKLGDLADRFSGAAMLIDPDGSPLPPESSTAALALGSGRAYEGREAVLVRPDGSRRTVLDYVAPVHDHTGRVTGVTVVLVDVTEREKMQHAARAALEQSEANLRGFFDSDAVGAAQADSEGRFVRVNDRYCEITGYSREELLTMGPFELDHPDDREADRERVQKAIADPRGVYHNEKRYLRKDGTPTWVHVAVKFLRDSKKQTVQSAAIVLDINERKRAEEALQQADRLKDEFLAVLAHELRNPLAPLQSAADLLRHTDACELDWCREVIDRQVTHLTRLIDDLLDVSRITRDKLELRLERVELAEVIENAIEASRPVLEHGEQTLTTQLPAEPVHLDGDAVRLTQIFTNLLTNAAKFTTSPGVVRLVAALEGPNVRISVRDSGVGIAKEELPRIFDKFDQSRRGRGALRGLGIGLPLAQRLAELHGGSIEARSAGSGLGSEFIVRLPLAAPQAPAQASAAANEHASSRKTRILVVDDNADSADALGRLLSLMGHDTAMEYDGPSALRRAQAFRPDVVLLDLGMADMDGFEVCRRLREHAPATTTKPTIVALTGWGRREDLERTEQAGFDGHLVKPVDREALERLLHPA